MVPEALTTRRPHAAVPARPYTRWALVTPLPWFGRQTGRSAFQCLQQFQQHNKDLKRRAWTEAEDRMLTQLVQEMRVGNHIPYRRSECARGRAADGRAGAASRSADGEARPEEGGRVLCTRGPGAVLCGDGGSCLGPAVTFTGPFSPVVYYMEGRDSVQLIYRWTKNLDPRLRKGLWTPEEDTVGVGPGRLLGRQWGAVAATGPGVPWAG